MIVYRKGDVVEAFKNGDIDVLVHGVNCQGKMNSGIAKQIRAEFPQVFEEYHKLCVYKMSSVLHSSELLGNLQYIQVLDEQQIVNAFTQDNYGYEIGKKYCSYDAIDACMKNLAKELRLVQYIGMPLIGSKRGGGDWKVIEAIINSHFKDRDVFVYTLENESDQRIKEHTEKQKTRQDVDF